jgi:threonine dehydrogenase-like Zn-dependent dehydrogenase
MKLPMVPPDKGMHLIYGAGLSALGAAVAMVLAPAGYTILAGLVAGPLTALAAGAGKEAWDRFANKRAVAQGQPEPHTVERADAIFTVIGSVPLAAVLALLLGLQ